MRYIRARSYDRWLGTKDDIAQLVEIASSKIGLENSKIGLENDDPSTVQVDDISARALEGIPKSTRALVELLLEDRASRSRTGPRVALEILNSRTKLRVSGDPVHVLNHVSPDEISEMILTGQNQLLEREIEIRFDEHGVQSAVSSPDQDWVNARDSEFRDALKKCSAGLRTSMSLLLCLFLTTFIAVTIYKGTELVWNNFADSLTNTPPGTSFIHQASNDYVRGVASRMSQPVTVFITVVLSFVASLGLWDVAKRMFRSISPGFRVVDSSRPQPPRQFMNALGLTLLAIPSGLIVWWLTKP